MIGTLLTIAFGVVVLELIALSILLGVFLTKLLWNYIFNND